MESPKKSEEWSPAWKTVSCSKCGKTYQCTPEEDYYNSTNATNGVCEKCLVEGQDELSMKP